MGTTVFKQEVEPIELWDVFFKGYYLEPRTYKNPVSEEQEARDPTILFGVKMQTNYDRLKEHKEEQAKRFGFLPEPIRSRLSVLIKRLKKAWDIIKNGEQKETEKFEYGKFRKMKDLYPIALGVGKSVGWLYEVHNPEMSEENVVENLKNFVETGFYKGSKHHEYYLRDKKTEER